MPPSAPAAATVAVAVATTLALLLIWKRRSRRAEPPLQRAVRVAQDTQKCFVGPLAARISFRQKQAEQDRLQVDVVNSSHWFGWLFRSRRHLDFEQLTGCRFTPYLVFERERDLRSVGTWAMPPPCSPRMPFGSIPSAEAAGCASQLSRILSWPAATHLVVQEAPDVGLGLFAAASIASDTAVCEYTGLVRVDPPQAELEADDYAYALPVCDPNVVISARDIGGVARLLNHGENPNCELRTVHHEEFLHVVCFTLRRIERGEQCLISYGEPYWRNERRRRKRVQL